MYFAKHNVLNTMFKESLVDERLRGVMKKIYFWALWAFSMVEYCKVKTIEEQLNYEYTYQIRDDENIESSNN